MNDDTLSVKEAAKLLGISEQAVYKRLNTTFQPYVEQRLNNRGKPQKCLNRRILDDFGAQNKQKTAKSNSTVEQPFNSTVEQPLNNHETARNDDLTAFLKEQIRIKDQQINALTAQNDKLLEALQAAQILQAKAQAQLEAHRDPAEDPQPEAVPKEQKKKQESAFLSWWHSIWY